MYAHHAPSIILASASPARRKLLSDAGIDAEILVSGVDEESVNANRPETLCGVLARMKAHAVADRLKHTERPAGGLLVLGCDSLLAFEGQALGKPKDPDEAFHRWQAMRGKSGVLHTGHCLIKLATGKAVERVASTVVHFADVSDDEIETYVASGEPLHVAGSFTLDGLSSPYVDRIEGDPSNVIGLSLPTLRGLLGELDIAISALWRTNLKA
ncbi:septum formation protein [Allocatelliglobosispora scoriae]|uniref:Nucleoside triphosphate pyrophosphatase n=1 Tax=Allocatelliglobosispora scoriae TaxID=643052 RepID=A0A841BVB7_9ACTN|nr:nucleoside triphosphate pyrophosphatase [Allocatelliglobosispora scoriae]MBB5871625.1 septum formation protein [Allocatelliglobosispora scoriae]